MQLDPNALSLPVDFLRFLPLVRRIGVAVSGGSDSLALLHLVTAAAREAGVEVQAATVDHGLRQGAGEDVRFVAEVCVRLEVPHEGLVWSGWDGRGNLQSEARDARYRLLAEWARAGDIQNVVLGHTADDLAETMIMRLARGAGVDGLTGMADRTTKHRVTFLRPILRLRRAALQTYLRELDQDWRSDPSNEDERFDRIRIRKAMPVLEALGLTPEALALVAENMQVASLALRADMVRAAQDCVTSSNGDLLIDRDAFLDLNPEQARRIILACLGWMSGEAYHPRREVQIKLIHAVRHLTPATASGCLITPEGQTVRISRELNAVRAKRVTAGEVWDDRWMLKGQGADGMYVAPLGEDGIRDCPEWREAGLPRSSVLASPAVWQGDALVAAPLAGNSNGWTARIVTDFHEWLDSH